MYPLRFGIALIVGILCAFRAQTQTARDWISPSGSVLPLNHPYRLEIESESPVAFRVLQGPALIDGDIITVTDLGPVEVVAEELGGDVGDSFLTRRVFNVGQVELELVGEYDTWGSNRVIEVADGFVYLGKGADLQVIDARQPGQPHPVLTLTREGFSSREIRVVGGFAYVLSDRRGGGIALQVFDVSIPGEVNFVGEIVFDEGKHINGFLVEDSVGYFIASGVHFFSGLEMISVDLADPLNPSLLGRFELEGNISSIHAVGRTMYIARPTETRVFDIRDLQNPRLVGTRSQETNFRPRFYRKNLGCVTNVTGDLELLDYRDLAYPYRLATFSPRGRIKTFQIVGDRLYASDSLGLSIVDIADPSYPILLGYSEQYQRAERIRVDGNRVYLVSPWENLRIFELKYSAEKERLPQHLIWPLRESVAIERSPLALDARSRSGLPLHYSVVQGPARIEGDRLVLEGVGRVVVRCEHPGNEQFLPASEEWGFDVSGEAISREPQVLNWISPPLDEPLILNQPYPLVVEATSGLPVAFSLKGGPAVIEGEFVTVTDLGTVLLSASQDGNQSHEPVFSTQAFNRSDGELIHVADYGSGESIFDVEVQGGLVYLAKGAAGFEILDVSDLENPVRLGAYQSQGRINDLAVSNDLVLLANDELGLEILNVADPLQPRRVGRADYPCNLVELRQGLAVLGRSGPSFQSHGIDVIDVRAPTAPRWVGSYYNSDPITSLTADGTTWYVGANWTGDVSSYGDLYQVDLSDPESPMRDSERFSVVGYRYSRFSCRHLFGHVWDVQAVGELIYVANGERGLEIYNRTDQSPVLLGQISHPSASMVRVDGGFAAVGFYRGFESHSTIFGVLDVVEPDRPKFLEVLFPAETIESVAVEGLGFYLGLLGGGLKIYSWIPERLSPNLSRQVPGRVVLEESPVRLPQRSQANLPLSYEVSSGPGRIEGDQLHLSGLGTIELRVQQTEENEQFRAADQSFPVEVLEANGGEKLERQQQMLQWLSPAADTRLPIGLPTPIRLRSNSELPVTFEVESGSARIDGDSLIVTGPGSVSLVAYQEGDAVYAPTRSRISINYSLPTDIELIGHIDLPGVSDVEVVGDRVFVTNTSLLAFDVSNPEQPVPLGGFEHSAFRNGVTVIDGLAYGAAGTDFVIVDVSDPAQMSLLAEYSAPEFSFSRVQVVEGRAYLLAQHLGGLEILDVSCPRNPSRLGVYTQDPPPQADTAVSLQVAKGVAYLGSPSVVEMVDVRDSSHPERLGYLSAGEGVQVVGENAFRIDNHYSDSSSASVSFDVLDLSDPTRARKVGGVHNVNCSTGSTLWYWNIGVRGSEAFIYGIDAPRIDAGLVVYDIRDLEDPRGVRLFPVSNPPGTRASDPLFITDLQVDGDTVFMARAGDGGVTIHRIEYERSAQGIPLARSGVIDLKDSPIELPDASREALPMTFTVVDGPARIEEGHLIVTGPGRVSVRIEQTGNEQFLPVLERWTFTVPIPRPELSIAWGPDQRIELQVPTVSGLSYSIQGRRSPSEGAWETWATSVGTGEPWFLSVDPMGASEMYLQVQVFEEGME